MTINDATDGVSRFRQRLLPLTLDHGRQIDFYRRHWAGAAEADGLATLPTVSKATHRAQLEDMRHPKLRPAVLVQTTGTTGRPFRQFRSREELDAYREYVQARAAKTSSATTARPLLAFNTVPAHVHGASIDGGHMSHHIAIDVSTQGGVRNAISLLREPALFHHEGTAPIRMLSGSPHMLTALTAACELAGVEPAELGIDELYSISDLLTGTTRRYLQRRWTGSRVHDVFSCSELIGAAGECPDCDGYHYEPTVWPEILDLDRDEPCRRGDVGELTVTELFPFSQLQPMLRYRTGDVVQRLTCPARPGDPAFRPLGRRYSCPTITVAGRSHVLVGGTTLREALEEDPEVARAPLLGVPHPVIGRLPAGLPRADWTLRGDGDVTHLELAVEAAFSTGLHPARAAALRERLVAQLTALLTVPAGASVVLDVTVREAYGDKWGLWTRPFASPEPEPADPTGV